MSHFVFNFYEGIFWILCSSICLVALKFTPSEFKTWLKFSAANVFLFGLSDFVEMYTGGFIGTASWLLYWKTVHVIGLVISVGWYISIRVMHKK